MGPADGEVFVMCDECGARLRSEDSRTGERYRGVKCPYNRDENGECVTPDERPDLYCR